MKLLHPNDLHVGPGEIIAHELAPIRRRFGDAQRAEKRDRIMLSASGANPARTLLETEVSDRGRYENTDFVQIRVEKC